MLPDEKIKLVPDDKIRRVVMCSGKVYYDLYEEREKRGINDVYLMRVEQLYPFPHKALDPRSLARFKSAEMVWCQEEPLQHGRLDVRRSPISSGRSIIIEAQVQAAALCRPPGVGGDRDGTDSKHIGAEEAHGRSSRRQSTVRRDLGKGDMTR